MAEVAVAEFTTRVASAGRKPNRCIPAATVIPVLIYPDVRAAVAWLSAAFGFAARVRIGENHRAQFRFGARGATDRRSRRVGGRRRARPVSERDRAAAERNSGPGVATTGAVPRSIATRATRRERRRARPGATGQARGAPHRRRDERADPPRDQRHATTPAAPLPRPVDVGRVGSDHGSRHPACLRDVGRGRPRRRIDRQRPGHWYMPAGQPGRQRRLAGPSDESGNPTPGLRPRQRPHRQALHPGIPPDLLETASPWTTSRLPLTVVASDDHPGGVTQTRQKLPGESAGGATQTCDSCLRWPSKPDRRRTTNPPADVPRRESQIHSRSPDCPLPLKSAKVRFNSARRWFVPLQLPRIERPSGVSCGFGPARPTVGRRFIGTNPHRWKREMPGSNVHPCQSNISAQVSGLRPGNLRRQRTLTTQP